MKYNVKTEQGTGTPEKSALKVRVYEEETEPIGTDGIADGAITSAKIADGAVTADKLAEGAIPTASASTLGGVKVGDGLSIDSDGVLSAGSDVFIIEYYVDVMNNDALVLTTPIEDILTAYNNHMPLMVCNTTLGGYSYPGNCGWFPSMAGTNIARWDYGLAVTATQTKSVYIDNYTLSNDGTITKNTGTYGTLNS